MFSTSKSLGAWPIVIPGYLTPGGWRGTIAYSRSGNGFSGNSGLTSIAAACCTLCCQALRISSGSVYLRLTATYLKGSTFSSFPFCK